MTLKLGHLTLDAPFFQAPLSGYTDYAMRRIALDFDCPLTFTGVMLAKSAAHPKVLAKPAFRPHDDEHPVGAQILGADPEVMTKAARDLVDVGYDLIDLNFACPAPKSFARRRGGFLLNDPVNAIEIFRRVRDAISCPLLIKLRTSYDHTDQSHENFWQIAETLAAEGADALVAHPRSVKKKFAGKADWNILAKLKRKLPNTTIIGSGDIFDAPDAVKKLRDTKIDGILVARSAIGNPWIFRDLRAALNDKPAPPAPTLDEQAKVIAKHFELICQLYPKRKVIGYFRKFAANYCRLHPQRKKAQQDFFTAPNPDAIADVIKKWYPTETSTT